MLISSYFIVVSSLDVRFQSGKHDGNSVPLHISVRFDDDIIIRSYHDEFGEESGEEREENLDEFTVPNPLLPGAYKNSNSFF